MKKEQSEKLDFVDYLEELIIDSHNEIEFLKEKNLEYQHRILNLERELDAIKTHCGILTIDIEKTQIWIDENINLKSK
jgi:hypothetical protein